MMERYLDAVGDYVQVVQNNDDFGSQTGLLVSPEIYRKFFKPRHARINAVSYTHLHVISRGIECRQLLSAHSSSQY